MKTSRPIISVYQSAVVLALLLGVANATALTKSPIAVTTNAAARVATPVATATSTPNTLTPTAPTASPVLPISEDIRDIRQPRHLPSPWFWVAIAVGVFTFFAAACAIWCWIRHGKFFAMLPHEIALQGLEEARRLMDPDHAREYCFEVSNVIRRYLEQQFHLQASQLTTEEFLRELVEVRETMLGAQRAALGNFLLHCDLAKFAGWRYCRPDLEAMHTSAVQFVRQTTATAADASKSNTSANLTPTQDVSPATDVQHLTTV